MKTSMVPQLILLFVSTLALSACGPSFHAEEVYTPPPSDVPEFQTRYQDYPTLPWTPETEHHPGEPAKPVAPKKPMSETERWANYLYSVLDTEAPHMLEGSEDMDLFCPNYDALEKDEKIHFWSVLLVEMIRHESSFNPKARTAEPGRRDRLTGGALYSEGLLQLSYQDLEWMPKCKFNIDSDKRLKVTDPRKTIFDPYINLQCGVLIMDRQIRLHKNIAIGPNAYWAVIKTDSKYKKIAEISKATKALAICKKPAPTVSK